MNSNHRPKGGRPLLETLTITVLYATLGKACTLLAHSLSSGNIILFWPPAGRALAAFMLLDWRAGAGVWLTVTQVSCKPEKIIFEVTETSVPNDLAKAIEILARLRLKGFVRAAETDTASRLIVESSIALGKQLGLKVLAEGVENEALWRWLRVAGCELAQGYFIAQPMLLEKVAAWQGEWEARRWALV